MNNIKPNTQYVRLTLLSILIAGIGLGHQSLFAQNQDAIALYQRSLAATCANCHGTNGHGVVDGGMPLINSLSSAKILSILQEYKSGERPGTVMPQLAKGYSDEQLQIIANQLGTK
jgi:cytochrome c553